MKEKIIRAAFVLFRSVSLLTVNILVTYAAYSFISPNYADSNATIHLMFASVMFLISYFSFSKFLSVYNKRAREEFTRTKEKASFSKTLFTKPYFWCDIALFVFLIFAFDLDFIYPFASEIAGRYYLFGIEAKLYAMLYMLPTVILLNVWTKRSAYKVWMRTRRRIEKGYIVEQSDGKKSSTGIGASRAIVAPPALSIMRVVADLHSKHNPAVQNAELPEPDYSTRGTAFALFYKLLMYVMLVLFGLLISAFVLAFLGPIVAIVTAALPRLFGKLIVAILVAVILFKNLNRFNQRRKFIKRLKKLCRENKFKLSRIKTPYSFMSDSTFIVTANGKTFECKTIGTRKAKTPIVLDADGTGITIHAFVFAGIRWWHYTEEFKFAYDSKYTKILIINPNAKFIYKNRDGEYGELDNGDTVGDYRIHTGQSFLNGLNRDCLDRKVKD